MRHAYWIMLALMVSACGVQGPLLRPNEIPEWERKRQEKLEKQRIEPEVMLQWQGAA